MIFGINNTSGISKLLSEISRAVTEASEICDNFEISRVINNHFVERNGARFDTNTLSVRSSYHNNYELTYTTKGVFGTFL